MLARLGRALRAIFVGYDCALAALLMAPKFILFDGQVPNGRQTISGLIGRAAANGRPWGRALEKPIDVLFTVLGSRPQHCRRTYRFEMSRGIQS